MTRRRTRNQSDANFIDDEIDNDCRTATAYVNAFSVAASVVPIPCLSATQVALWSELSTMPPFAFAIKLKADLVLAVVARELLKSAASDQGVVGKILTRILSKNVRNQRMILNDLTNFIQSMRITKVRKLWREKDCYVRRLLKREMTRSC